MNGMHPRRSFSSPAVRLAAPILVLATLILACSSSPPPGQTTAAPPPATPPPATPPPPGATPPPGTAPEAQPGTTRELLYRFTMDSPANSDFAFNDDLVFIYVRPYKDYLSMKVQARRQIPIKIHWNESELVDILGRRYKLVPPTATLEMAARNILTPTELRADDIFSGRVLLLDPTLAQTIRNLGSAPVFPVVPPDAGPPEQIRGKSFTMRLALEINAVRTTYDFIFSIIDSYYR